MVPKDAGEYETMFDFAEEKTWTFEHKRIVLAVRRLSLLRRVRDHCCTLDERYTAIQ